MPRAIAPTLALLAGLGVISAQEVAPAPAPAPSPAAEDRLVVESEQAAPDYRTDVSSAALFGERTLRETPFSVGTYNEALIEDQRAFTTAEVLKNEPSAFVTFPGGSYGYYDSFGLRGFATHNWYSYRVDGSAIANQGENPIDNKERVEVLKGPTALRYGFAPSGGMINYVRKRPTDQPTLSVQFDGTSDGLLYTQADTGGRVGDEDRVGYRLVAAGERFDSFWDEADGQRTFFSALTDYRINDRTTVWVAWERNHRDTVVNPGIPVSVTGRIFTDLGPDTFLGEDWARYTVKQENTAVGADLVLAEGWKLVTSSAYNRFHRDDRRVGFTAVQDNGNYTATEYDSPNETRPSWTHQTHVEGRFATGPLAHDLAVGVSWRRLQAFFGAGASTNIGPSNVYAPVDIPDSAAVATPSRNRIEFEEWGLFATDTIRFSEQWAALIGVRYGRLAQDSRGTNGLVTQRYDEGAVSPTAAVMFAPIPAVNTYLLYTEGLQAGGVAPTTASNANEALPPLRSRQIELGAKAAVIEGRLDVEAAFFRIAQDLEYTNAGNTYVQDGEQLHQGVEATARGRVTDRFSLSGGLMLLDAEQVETGNAGIDGKRPRGAQEWSGNLWADYELPWVRDLAVLGGVYVMSERFADNAERIAMDEYVRFDAGVRYRLRSADTLWTGRLLVENLADEEYFVGGSSFGTGGTVYYGAPRTVRLSIQADF